MPLPVILWGLDPLFLAFRKLLVASIFANVEKVIRGDDRYEFYLFDRPVQKIEIVGTIIGKVVRAKRVLLYVDDGTGVIECSKIYNAEGGEPTPLVEFRNGDRVSIRGTLAVAGDPQTFVIHITYAARELSVQNEITHYLESMYFMKSVYNRRLVLPLGEHDDITKQNATSIGCCCGTPATVKHGLLFCRCTASNIFAPLEHDGAFAVELLEYFVNTFEAALDQEECLVMGAQQVSEDPFVLAMAQSHLQKRVTVEKNWNEGGDASVLSPNVFFHTQTSTSTSAPAKRPALQPSTLIADTCQSLVLDGVLEDRHGQGRAYTLMSLDRALAPRLQEAQVALGIYEVSPRLLAELRRTSPRVPRWRWQYTRRVQEEEEEGSWNGDSDHGGDL